MEYAGRPVSKLSAAKATAPGAKQVFRGPEGDVIALRDEPAPPATEPLLRLVMRNGRRTEAGESLEAKRERFLADLAWLPAEATRIEDPRAQDVRTSDALRDLHEQTRTEMLTRQSSIGSRS